MSLRLKIHLIVGLLTLLFVSAIAWAQLLGLRDAVKEEVVAANRVATQLLRRNVWLQAAQGTPAMLAFLQGLGRVRSNDLLLSDAQGQVIYRSPPSPYKAGINAPDWFERLVSPEPSVQAFDFPGGRLEVRANASRAVLDAWESLRWLAAVAGALLLAVNVLVYALVGRTLRPFARIVQGLQQLEAGRFDVALPPLPGREAGAIGAAFNRMVAGLSERMQAQQRAALAEHQLQDQRELAQWVNQRVEDERRMIARELHDELGQSVTAMRSLALSVAQRVQVLDPESARAAHVIAEESSRLYDAMHGLIPRLAPLVLDELGLPEALQDLTERTRRAHAGVTLDLHVSLAPMALGPDRALALYRAAQEGITNALRHGQAQHLSLSVTGDERRLQLRLEDDGRGPPEGPQVKPDQPARGRAGHHGLRWLDERVQALGGHMSLGPRTAADGTVLAGGACLQLEIPMPTGSMASSTNAPANVPTNTATNAPTNASTSASTATPSSRGAP